MLKFLVLMLLAGSAPALVELDEEIEDSSSQPQIQLRQQLESPTSFGLDVAGGVLKIQSLIAPSLIDKERLRMMTNVDRSTPLSWQDWGNYSGYQYDYSERGSFFRQWWLVDQRTIIFVVYESSVEIEESDIAAVDRIVKSLTVGGS
jgi:hypothetical protein